MYCRGCNDVCRGCKMFGARIFVQSFGSKNENFSRDGRYAVSGPVAETEREKVLGDAVYKIEWEVIAPASLIHEKVIAGERTIKEEEEAYRKVVNTIADFLKEEKYNDMTPGEHRICSDLRRDLSFYVKRLALLEEGNLYQPFEIENFKKARQAYLESL